jgi:23S rRNA (uridine2552-2'-O)-methyltransferase
MARSKSSRLWLQEHFADPFVHQAQKDGYRSRAVYKLQEIQKAEKFLQPGMTVVDLGAAPGGWSQLTAEILCGRGRIIASDLLPIAPLAGVTFVQGDFTEESVLMTLIEVLHGEKVDVVLSDMAPNMSGIAVVDQSRSVLLAELALDFCRQFLKPGGSFLTKLFQGSAVDGYFAQCRQAFAKVSVKKPAASRARSREFYLFARQFRG